ncbi:MAG TPA: T9SS type A sorting domain-containing protein, partial [Candidatus Cloacimonas sp.]|nr:T9SS type A sorting domain-containing protein [Candidatus Cloacimonas sp.]
GYVENEDETIPSSKEVILYKNYPNPFNPETTIVFSLPVRMPVCLEVFNVKGQLVNRLLNDTLPAGTHRIVFNGLDIKKHNIASGVYYYRITTPSGVQMRKMLLLK